MNPAFKKAFKYVVIVLFVLIISGFIFIVQLLPSQKQIAKFLKSPPLKSNLQRGNSTDPPANATVNAPSTASELKTEPPAVASAQTSEDQSKK